MSWGFTASQVTVEELEDKFAEFTTDNPWHRDQFAAAVNAAFDILDSGALGDPETKKFNVSFSGHGNTNHEPDPGWTNDSLTISFYQLSPPPEEISE